jgi:hypothetical protein
MPETETRQGQKLGGMVGGSGQSQHLGEKIGRLEPHGIVGLAVRHEAMAWLMLEADDVIVDARARDAFLSFGRALRRLVRAKPEE